MPVGPIISGKPVQRRRPFPMPPGARLRLPPANVTRLDWISPEHREIARRAALQVFTDMTASGYTLDDVLASIYLTGAQHALLVQAEDRGDR